jgi:mono/diheme cytochrome c family protein
LKLSLLLSAAVLFVIAAGYTSAPTLAAGLQLSTNPVRPTGVSQEKAKKMYAVDCAVCHGETGDGKTDLAKDMAMAVPDWTDPKTLGSKSDQELFDIIRKGKDKMPPEDAGRAKDAEVWGLVTYIRVLSKNHTAAPAAPVEPAAPAAPAAPVEPAAPTAPAAPVAPPAPTN